MNDRKEVAFSDVAQQIDNATTAADQHRADAIDRLIVTRKAKETGLAREQARLTKKLGAEHPRVVAIAHRRDANAGLRRDLTLESARARTEIPKVGAETWVLAGIVRDAKIRPVPGVTVALYDANGRWVRELGYGCSDPKGRFQIAAKNVRHFDQPVFARATSADGAVLAVDRTPLNPQGGALDYREIVVSDTAQRCQPPDSSSQPPPAPAPAPNAWVVRGRVTDKAGDGIAGLTVSVFDKEMIFADRLGQTRTDEHGDYAFVYRTDDFHDLIERKADIYLRVVDRTGETLYTSQDAVRYEAGRVETINAQVERRKT